MILLTQFQHTSHNFPFNESQVKPSGWRIVAAVKVQEPSLMHQDRFIHTSWLSARMYNM